MDKSTELLDELLIIVNKYLAGDRGHAGKVVDYLAPRDLKNNFNTQLGDGGCSAKELLRALDEYLKYSVRTGSTNFYNQLYGGFEIAAFIGEVATALTNTSMYTYEVAPVATLMEMELIKMMNGKAGFEDGSGIFCTGGSNANMIALMCARNMRFPGCQMKGMPVGVKPALFISDQAHYSFRKAANILGIGQDRVIKVITDSRGRMAADELEKAVIKSKDRGETPFFTAATAGTTVLGAFDPVPQIADIAKKHNLWLHIDGAWGGPVLLSKKHRILLEGSELADSFTWDAHKLMGVPLICTAFLTKHKNLLAQSCALEKQDTSYLFHENEEKDYNLGHNSLQCGRRVDSLKLWLLWKYIGTNGFEKRIDHLFDMAKYADSRVSLISKLESAGKPDFLNICFRYIPDNGEEINSFNKKVREKMRKEGKIHVNYSQLNSQTYFRLVLSNPEVTKKDIDFFFNTLLKTGRELEKIN